MSCATFMHSEKTHICEDIMAISDYKALPFLFVLNHPVTIHFCGSTSKTTSSLVTIVVGAIEGPGLPLALGGVLDYVMIDVLDMHHYTVVADWLTKKRLPFPRCWVGTFHHA